MVSSTSADSKWICPKCKKIVSATSFNFLWRVTSEHVDRNHPNMPSLKALALDTILEEV